MFDNITFHSNPYFGYIATFIYFSQHPLCIFYTARCVHFTVPSIRRGALFFLRGHMYTNGSRFIKKISSLGNILKKTRLPDKLLCYQPPQCGILIVGHVRSIFGIQCKLNLSQIFWQYLGTVKQATHKSRFIISPIFYTFKTLKSIKKCLKENTVDMLSSVKFFAEKLTV